MAEVKLNNVEYTLKMRVGARPRVYKPHVHYNHAQVPEGELLYCSDTEGIYYTTATRVLPVQTVNMLVVHDSDFVWHNDEPVIND